MRGLAPLEPHTPSFLSSSFTPVLTQRDISSLQAQACDFFPFRPQCTCMLFSGATWCITEALSCLGRRGALLTPSSPSEQRLWSSQAAPRAEKRGGRRGTGEGPDCFHIHPGRRALGGESPFPRAHAPHHRSSDSHCFPCLGSSGRMKV